MRRVALAVVALAGIASANGRPPETSTIRFRQGHETDIVAGMTFGVVLSHDGGATWQWMCETAVGYGGVWDPDFSYTSSGTVFGTTFTGLKVMRDGCTFGSAPPGTLLVSTDELGADGSLLIASADDTDDKVYKSVDDGMSFPTSTTPPGAMLGDWYTNLYIQPGQSANVWLAAYRFPTSTSKSLSVYTSTNGGATFTSVTTNGFTSPVALATQVTIEGVDGLGNVYARETFPAGQNANNIYKLAANGTSWTPILNKPDTIAFLVRSNGELVAATKTLGAWVSTDQGTTWTALTNPPHMNCLVENSAHEVWACTQNYGEIVMTMTTPSDGFGIMKTTDLVSWSGVLKYENIAGPVTCPAGTPQHDTCTSMYWCGLRSQLAITANPVDCGSLAVDGPQVKSSTGCCESGAGSTAPVVIGALVGIVLRRRNRR